MCIDLRLKTKGFLVINMVVNESNEHKQWFVNIRSFNLTEQNNKHKHINKQNSSSLKKLSNCSFIFIKMVNKYKQS